MESSTGDTHVTFSRTGNRWQESSTLQKFLLVGSALLLVLVIVLSALTVYFSGKTTEYCVTPGCVTAAAAVLKAMDQSVDPCTDFYQYACGGWIKSHPIPDGKDLTTTLFEMAETNRVIMKNMLEDERFQLKGKGEEMARMYYKSCLDENGAIEKLGGQPLLDLIKKMGGWSILPNFNIRTWNFQKTLDIIHNQYDLGGLFSWGPVDDTLNPGRRILILTKGEILFKTELAKLDGGESKEPGAKTLETSQTLVDHYEDYMTKIGVLLGGEENYTRAQIKEAIKFESKLAEFSDEDPLNVFEMLKRPTVNDLQRLAPAINWIQFFNSAFRQIDVQIFHTKKLIIVSPGYLRKMSELVTHHLSTDEGKVVLHNYLIMSAIKQLVPYLSKSFRDLHEVMDQAVKEYPIPKISRWRKCLAETDAEIDAGMGAMFVREVFHGENKPLAESMLDEIRYEFKRNLPNLKWMDPETRKLAVEKVDAIKEKVGFPEYMLDPVEVDKEYISLDFEADKYFQNKIALKQFTRRLMMKLVDQLADQKEWLMKPQTVNAAYVPLYNSIILPAAFLQAPIFDPSYPKSLIYGSMGTFMAHELSHAFDSTGRKYDKHGLEHQWWKNSTIELYEEQAKCFVEQFSSYSFKWKLDGEKTLGENIADSGAVKTAFHAYQNWAANNPKELPLPGVPLSNHQLYFIGFAQGMCSVAYDKFRSLQVLVDAHSLEMYRINGSLSNSVDFAREFKCSSQSAMNPENKCSVL